MKDKEAVNHSELAEEVILVAAEELCNKLNIVRTDDNICKIRIILYNLGISLTDLFYSKIQADMEQIRVKKS